MFVALTMNVSILSLRRHSDPGEIFPATVRIKVQLVANAVSSRLVNQVNKVYHVYQINQVVQINQAYHVKQFYQVFLVYGICRYPDEIENPYFFVQSFNYEWNIFLKRRSPCCFSYLFPFQISIPRLQAK